MDAIGALIPPKYAGAVLALLAAIKCLDIIVCAIPDEWVSAHSTVAAIVNAVKWLYGRTKGVKVPGAAAGMLLALATLAGCATYTQAQTAACIQATVPALHAEFQAGMLCRQAAKTKLDTDIAACGEAEIEGAGATAAAAVICAPVKAAPAAGK